MKRCTGTKKDDRDKKIRQKFKEIKKQYPYYKYTEICKMVSEHFIDDFGIGISMVRKVIEK